MSSVHCNLRVLMAERQLNIQQIKDKTTLSRTTISNLYNNKGAGVRFSTISQLCKLLNCQPGDLFRYQE
ncbi:helix-turn-helix transcriptional regulator [Virgibacillus sp. AGTR]|uniref:helix-turn-helix domain-containing protein n=1 Tax=Virgibacillus sp. AGTR TaxID=2812055 RepID=UPI001D161820|nr:helix-turn-helix transcriptional regulator [Virgibacillus sp. AGTR]MCC2249101.1 helix-turn-helix transcriptional regulator [Virgibacillus sp. AGTR]